MHWVRRGFNPRAPCGARRSARWGAYEDLVFQSTRPMRGATKGFLESLEDMMFQSTRPMRGATRSRGVCCPASGCFNPRAPYGARRSIWIRRTTSNVSIHAPHAGRDLMDMPQLNAMRVSIHAPHAGRDLRQPPKQWGKSGFNPRAPCGARPAASRKTASL